MPCNCRHVWACALQRFLAGCGLRPAVLQEQDADFLPGSPPHPELQFAQYLFDLPKRAHLGSDVGVFLRKNKMVADGTSVGQWLSKRKFLFRLVDTNYVELVQPYPNEDKEAFMDKVGELQIAAACRTLSMGHS